jgi:predicted aminopeptidase
MRRILTLLVPAVLLTLQSCYYLNQGAVLVSQRSSARNFDAALHRAEREYGADSAEYRELSAFFARVEGIRSFGIDELGLSEDRNYTTFLDLDRDYMVAVVNAAPADSLAPYQWKYPFFGPAPYRGFFDRDQALREAARLEEAGYETWVRRVDAFSTLGMTRDPLISFMIDYDDFALAQLIFHEQVHATLWVRGAVQFNEELATVLGRMAALEYLAATYGEDSAEIEQARNRLADGERFARDMNALAGELSAFYQLAGQASAEIPDDNRDQSPEQIDVERGKARIISSFLDEFESTYEERYRSPDFRALVDLEVNNAFISLYQTYEGRGSDYRRLYDLAGSVRRTLGLLAEALERPADYGADYRRGDDPHKLVVALISWLHQRSAS